ncbi:hypothetical protein ACFY0A_45445, partial [Streptomyces sp. NPDC001698]
MPGSAAVAGAATASTAVAANTAAAVWLLRTGRRNSVTSSGGQLLTFSAGRRDTMVKQTAVRDGSVLLIVSGSPALVDRHLDKTLAKATAAR